ncbi:hypothetical protein [Streptomyces leeuwenhoekii]|uniref:hypothetical protein n=1 Tax=Streptomyces leeuwenhoekii TaxID=1437453 RepID=UPI00131E49EF|nr:hypothetical protein [Streptomyces leeuwenhoekii]
MTVTTWPRAVAELPRPTSREPIWATSTARAPGGRSAPGTAETSSTSVASSSSRR